MNEAEFQIQQAQATDEILNPTMRHNAKKRRVLNLMRCRVIASVYPVSADKVIVDDANDIVETRYSYRTEVITKDPLEKLEAKAKTLSWVRLLRRRKQIARELRIAEGQMKANTKPKKVPMLQAKVKHAQWVSDAIEAAYKSRISGDEGFARLTKLTARVLKHKLHRGHKAHKLAVLRGDKFASELYLHRNKTLTRALREVSNVKDN
jgi:hypothetical protein